MQEFSSNLPTIHANVQVNDQALLYLFTGSKNKQKLRMDRMIHIRRMDRPINIRRMDRLINRQNNRELKCKIRNKRNRRIRKTTIIHKQN